MDIRNNMVKKQENAITKNNYKDIHLLKFCKCKNLNCIKENKNKN